MFSHPPTFGTADVSSECRCRSRGPPLSLPGSGWSQTPKEIVKTFVFFRRAFRPSRPSVRLVPLASSAAASAPQPCRCSAVRRTAAAHAIEVGIVSVAPPRWLPEALRAQRESCRRRSTQSCREHLREFFSAAPPFHRRTSSPANSRQKVAFAAATSGRSPAVGLHSTARI